MIKIFFIILLHRAPPQRIVILAHFCFFYQIVLETTHSEKYCVFTNVKSGRKTLLYQVNNYFSRLRGE